MEQKRRLGKSIVVFIVGIVLVLMVFAGFIFLLNQNLEQETSRYLSEATKQSVRMVKNKLEENFTYLKTVETAVMQYDSITDPGVIELLEQQSKKHFVANMAVVTPDGTAYTTGDQVYDVSRRDYFAPTLRGEEMISDVMPSLVDGMESIIFSIPLYRGEQIVGELICTYHLDMLKELLSTETLDGNTTVTVVKTDGKMLTPSDDIKRYIYYFNLLAQTELKDGVTSKEIRTAMESGMSGRFKYQMGNQLYSVSYAPVGTNNWYLLSTAPSSVIDAQSKEITSLAGILLLTVTVILLLCLLYFYREQHKMVLQLRSKELELEAITANIPGGVQVRDYTSSLTMRFFSKGFLNLTGYSQMEIEEKFEKNYKRMVYREDAAGLFQKIDEQIIQKHAYELEYRLSRKDGTVCWVLDKGQLVADDKDGSKIYSVIVDITKSKTVQQELQMSEERFQTIMERTDSVIFEWNIQEDSITFSDIWQKKFGYPAACQNFTEVLHGRMLHTEDRKVCTDMFEAARKGNPYGEVVVRFMRKGGSYLWCRVCMTAIFDASGNPCRAVGIVLDIDKDKRQTETLQERAEKDFLTQVYNKGTAAMLIQDCLRGSGSNGEHALLVLDVDNFKSVNDTLGHSAGDALLSEIGKRLQKPFRSTDIVARVGGDEFIVFMKEIGDEELIREKVQLVCDMFHDIKLGENEDFKISGSVGVALYPKDGASYEDLFRHADSALYQSKKQGKDQFTLYVPGQSGTKITK